MAKRRDVPSWMPMEGETSSAYAAFCIYRDLGIGRKLTAVGDISGEATGGVGYDTIVTWSKKFNWEQRILDYKAWESRQRADAEMKLVRKSIEEIQKERIDRIKMNLAVADLLRERGIKMLEYPICEKVRELPPEVQPDGRTLIVQQFFEPTKWTPKDAVVCLRAAAEIEKVAIYEDQAGRAEMSDDKKVVASDGLAEWRRQQMDQIREIPAAPPGALPPPDESDANDAA